MEISGGEDKVSKREYLRQEFYAVQLGCLVSDLMGDSSEYSDRRIKIRRDTASGVARIDYLRKQRDWLVFSTEVISSGRLRVSAPTLIGNLIDQFISEVSVQETDQNSEFDPVFYRHMDPDINDLNIFLQMFNFNVTGLDPHGMHVYPNLAYLISELQRRLLEKESGLGDFRFRQGGISQAEERASFKAFVATSISHPESMRGAEFKVWPDLDRDYGEEHAMFFSLLEEWSLLPRLGKVKNLLPVASFSLKQGFWFYKLRSSVRGSSGGWLISNRPKTTWWRTEE